MRMLTTEGTYRTIDHECPSERAKSIKDAYWSPKISAKIDRKVRAWNVRFCLGVWEARPGRKADIRVRRSKLLNRPPIEAVAFFHACQPLSGPNVNLLNFGIGLELETASQECQRYSMVRCPACFGLPRSSNPPSPLSRSLLRSRAMEVESRRLMPQRAGSTLPCS